MNYCQTHDVCSFGQFHMEYITEMCCELEVQIVSHQFSVHNYCGKCDRWQT